MDYPDLPAGFAPPPLRFTWWRFLQKSALLATFEFLRACPRLRGVSPTHSATRSCGGVGGPSWVWRLECFQNRWLASLVAGLGHVQDTKFVHGFKLPAGADSFADLKNSFQNVINIFLLAFALGTEKHQGKVRQRIPRG